MSDRKQYWSRHLAAIAAEKLTTKAYAEREGVSAAALYYWRGRLKAEATSRAAPAPERAIARKLVPVRVAAAERAGMSCTLTLASGIRLDLNQLPDPRWLAAVVAATVAEVR